MVDRNNDPSLPRCIHPCSWNVNVLLYMAKHVLDVIKKSQDEIILNYPYRPILITRLRIQERGRRVGVRGEK